MFFKFSSSSIDLVLPKMSCSLFPHALRDLENIAYYDIKLFLLNSFAQSCLFFPIYQTTVKRIEYVKILHCSRKMTLK